MPASISIAWDPYQKKSCPLNIFFDIDNDCEGTVLFEWLDTFRQYATLYRSTINPRTLNSYSPSGTKRILYIQVGTGFLYINRNVMAQLKKNFPDHEVELLDVMPEITRNPWAVFLNFVYVLLEYFPDFIQGRKNVFRAKYHFLGTTYIFNYFSKVVRKKVKSANYAFIVQSQCLCDASGNGVPVFIYTDHTNLNNLNYRFIDSSRYIRTKAFIELERRAFMHAANVFVMSPNPKILSSNSRRQSVSGISFAPEAEECP